jgi:3-methylcrotonyl-CoA carboxylase alpha subunit
VDAGYREGDTVTPFYDPMLAKIVAHGDSRDAARHRLIAALREFEIEGIRNNREFLIACLADPPFAAGDVSTGYIEQRLDHLLRPAAA